MKEIQCISNEISVIETDSIERGCVRVNCADKMYIQPLPNSLSYS